MLTRHYSYPDAGNNMGKQYASLTCMSAHMDTQSPGTDSRLVRGRIPDPSARVLQNPPRSLSVRETGSCAIPPTTTAPSMQNGAAGRMDDVDLHCPIASDNFTCRLHGVLTTREGLCVEPQQTRVGIDPVRVIARVSDTGIWCNHN